VYAAIVGDEIAIEQREYLHAVVREGWLVKQGGRVKTWKKRWVVVSASVLYYYEEKKSAQFKGMVPLEDVIVRTPTTPPPPATAPAAPHLPATRPVAAPLSARPPQVRASSERPFAFTLELAHSRSGVIKSAKAAADGSMTQGKHSAFVFSAESAEERAAWLRALNESILLSRFAPAPPGAAAGSTPGRAAMAEYLTLAPGKA